MRISGELISNLHRATILKAWPVTLSRDGGLYTWHIATEDGPLLIDIEAAHLENLRHAITMLLNFPRVTHIAFPLERTEQKQPEELSVDMPLV